MSVDTLKPSLIVETIEKLYHRIGDRFPNSGLKTVCGQLHQISKNMEARADWIGKPLAWLRALTWAICALIVVLALLPFFFVSVEDGTWDLEKVVTLMEAGLNDVVLIGAAIFFLLTVEIRYKRQRALKALHELRSIAHVIDMHQLTKDPHRIIAKTTYAQTVQSPKLEMTQFELRRYLDYCSEMLSLTGKVAAVYVQEFDDGVAMASASELETLTTGLSRKIWQKIAILHTIEVDDADRKPEPVPFSEPRQMDSNEQNSDEPTQ